MISNIKDHKLSIIFGIIAIAFAVGFFYPTLEEGDEQASKEDLVLIETINQCEEVTERAASHLKAIVEFQKLEIIGRKARVFKLCMQDHGYEENVPWLQYSKPVAAQKAKATNISIDEALENLRRTDMKISHGEEQRPAYWIKRKGEKS